MPIAVHRSATARNRILELGVERLLPDLEDLADAAGER
jgi:hypothetical protein